MIAKVTASGAAVTPVAAAALDKAKVVATEPVIWHFLGYSFEAAGMVAALFGCLAARYWVGAALALKKEHRWSIDVPVSGMALATSAGFMMIMRPNPLMSLLIGAGIGIIGEGLFTIAERQARASGALGARPAAPDPATRDRDTQAGIGAALRSLDLPPNP